MKSSEIHVILDIAKKIIDNGGKYYPLFIGAPGIGKSENVQAWAKKNKYNLLDLRLAYLESPDLVGIPVEYKDSSGVMRTGFATPEMWPSEGNWLIFLDELNRGNSQVLNCVMQMLTDKKVHKHVLPENVIFVGAINPETAHYDVNTLDPALRNRFQVFTVEYSHTDFLDYMKKDNWNPIVQAFVESGTWVYKTPEDTAEGVKPVSPRNLAVLNDAIEYVNDQNELMVYEGILGDYVAKTFLAFKQNKKPVFVKELLSKKKDEALHRLAVYSDVETYEPSLLSITVRDVVDNHNDVKESLLVELLEILPADQAFNLLTSLNEVKRDDQFSVELLKKHESIKQKLKQVARQGK